MSGKGLIRGSSVFLALGVLVLVVVSLAITRREGPAKAVEASEVEPPQQHRLLFFRTGYKPEGFITINLDGTDERVLVPLAEQRATRLYDGTQMRASPDGRLIAWSNGTPPAEIWRPAESGLWVMNWDGTGKRRLAQGAEDTTITNATWSPDGKRLAYARRKYLSTGEVRGELHVINVDGTGDQLVTQDKAFWPLRRFDMWWTMTDEIVWKGPGPEESHYVTLSTGRVAPLAPGVPWDALSISPDGRRAVLTADALPEQVKKPGLAIDKLAPRSGAPRWSPDGKAAVFEGLVDGNLSGLWFWDVVSGKKTVLAENRQGPHSAVSVAPDNVHVLYWTYSGLEVINSSTKESRLLVPAPNAGGKGGADIDFIDWIRSR